MELKLISGKYLHIALLILLLLGIIFPLKAQDSSLYKAEYTLDEVVVSSNKLDTKLMDVSTKVDIIDENKIEAANGTSLPGILQKTNAGFIKSYGHSQTLQSISINGLGTEHTLILMDGVRMNSYQNSQIDLSLIPKENIKRIEVINNGVSSIYGSSALGGVVNIITKNRENLKGSQDISAQASATQGSFDTQRYSLSVYKEYKNYNARIFYNNEESDGDFEYYYQKGEKRELIERQNAAYSLYEIGLNTQYIIDENHLIRLVSTYSNQDKEVPGIATGTPQAPTKQLDKNWNNILIVENNLSRNLSIRSNFNFQNNYMNYSVEPFLDSYYKNLVYSASTEIRYKREDYGFTSGYDFSHAVLESNEVEAGTQRNQHALFISSYYKPLEEVKIYPSVRYDYISDIETSALTYKLGLNYQPFEDINLSLRGNAGRNFRAPSFNDLYWENSGNKDLSPENSINAEAGLFYSFSGFINGEIDFAYTYIHAKDKIVWTPQNSGLWAPRNIAESVSNNLSISTAIRKEFGNNWLIRLEAGTKFINSKKTTASYLGDPSKGEFVPFIPLQSTNVNFSLDRGFAKLNLLFNHSGKRFSDFANEDKMPPYNLLDGNVTLEIDLFEITSSLRIEVNNILNTDYQIISGYPMPLRNYRLTISFKY
jgi:iron complex outermembrane receptor protein